MKIKCVTQRESERESERARASESERESERERARASGRSLPDMCGRHGSVTALRPSIHEEDLFN